MEFSKPEHILYRSKSTGFLDKIENDSDFKCFCGCRSDRPHDSVFSINGSGFSEEPKDSGISKSLMDGETLLVLEHKIDKVSEILQNQQTLLMLIREKLHNTGTEDDQANAVASDTLLKESNAEEITSLLRTNETTKPEALKCEQDEPSGARSLLSAIEMKQDTSLDHSIRIALENFLQSDSVKNYVATMTAESMTTMVHRTVYRAITSSYLPMVERSHRRLVSHVTKLLDDSFADLEDCTASWFKSIHNTSTIMRTALVKHQSLLKATDPGKHIKLLRNTLKGVLEEELRTWRGRVVQELSQGTDSGEGEPEHMELLASPMQPANPEATVIDNLMRCALIKKHIEDGDVSGAFEEALSSADLALVMAACRAAGPTAPGVLRPAALLALLQQLSTDMVHDTQLKCRYLEEAILKLEKCDAATRDHLPLVVREVREHLTRFLVSYPKHQASRRIALIVMAANNLN